MVVFEDFWKLILNFRSDTENTQELKMRRLLNQWHKFLTYDGVKEPAYSTVLEFYLEDPDRGPFEYTDRCFRYSFDDNGILRKEEEPTGELALSSYHCLKKIWLYNENGKLMRYCDACELEYCKENDEYVISMLRETIVDGKCIGEIYHFKMNDLFAGELPQPVKTYVSKNFDSHLTIDSLLYPNVSSSKRSLSQLRDESLKPGSVYNVFPAKEILNGSYDASNSIIWRVSPKFVDRLWLNEIVGSASEIDCYYDEDFGPPSYITGWYEADEEKRVLEYVHDVSTFLYLPSTSSSGDPISVIAENFCDDDTADTLERAYLEENYLIIEKDAFSRCRYLEKIYIPATVEKIGENAFCDCPNLTVYVQKGSYAEEYCIKNNLPYIANTEKVDNRHFFHLD